MGRIEQWGRAAFFRLGPQVVLEAEIHHRPRRDLDAEIRERGRKMGHAVHDALLDPVSGDMDEPVGIVVADHRIMGNRSLWVMSSAVHDATRRIDIERSRRSSS